MALPKIKVPLYDTIIPSTGEKILFRPFTVKEEKLLLIAIDDTPEVQIRALKQVLQNCLLPSKGQKFDIENFSVCDIDFLWLKIRSKSVEEIVTLPFECHSKLPDGQTRKDEEGNIVDFCGTVVQVPINLDTIEVKKNPENNPKIELQDGIFIKLHYPNFEIYQKVLAMKEDNNIDNTFAVIADCVDMIYEGNGKTYERIDPKELQEFLESLSQPQFAKIMKFFETLPVVRHEVKFKCPKCGHEALMVIEGTKSFLK
jgi:hypothetical protein